MPKSTKPKPKRPGRFVIDFDPSHRAMLESLRDERAFDSGEPMDLSRTLRWLIRTEFDRRNLKLPD